MSLNGATETLETATARNATAGRETHHCAQCDKPFTPARTDARYCSPGCRLKAHRAAKAAQETPGNQTATNGHSAKPKRPRPGGHKLRRIDPNIPKRPVTPTPRLYAPPLTDDRPGKYPPEVMDDILRRVSHGETLTQACNSNPGFPSPPTVIDWVNENRHNLAERYARARDRQLERWADDLVDTSAEALLDPAKAPGARLVLDAKKFLLSKLKPQVYGDKVDLTSAGQRITPVSLPDIELARRAMHWITSLKSQDVVDAEVVTLPALDATEPVKPEGEA